MSKTQKVLRHLKENGSITSWEAITKFRVTRLADVIYRLKKYHNIETLICEEDGDDGSTTRYARYIYKGEKA